MVRGVTGRKQRARRVDAARGWYAATSPGRPRERVLRRGFAGVVRAVGAFVAVQAALGHSPTPS